MKRLSSAPVYSLEVEAASEIADERLCQALLKLKEWWDVDRALLDEAVKNCCSSKKPGLTENL